MFVILTVQKCCRFLPGIQMNRTCCRNHNCLEQTCIYSANLLSNSVNILSKLYSETVYLLRFQETSVRRTGQPVGICTQVRKHDLLARLSETILQLTTDDHPATTRKTKPSRQCIEGN
jgi:hypothetical protein